MIKEVKFKDAFEFQKKSKIKAGDGLKLDEGKYSFYTSSNRLTKSINEYLFKKESLIFGTGGLASIHYCDEKFAVSTDCFVTQPKNSDELFLKYIYYFLSGNIHILENGFKGAGLKHISKGYISDIKIPLPPLDQQKKIAAILDAADAYRQKTKALITKYDALTQSLFLDMFGDPLRNPKGWEIVTIRDIITEAKYGTSSKADENGIYSYLRMNNITYKGHMDYSNLKYINVPDDQIHKYETKKGDILFNRTNSKELVGKTGIIATDDKMILAGYLIRLRMKEAYNPYFLWSHLNSKWAKITLKNMCKSIVGMANINAQELQNIKVVDPPMDLQNQFAERVQAIEAQKAQAQASLAQAEDLFNSLLQRAFKGELV
jgi:type I restriction enzyme S subunit